MTDTMQVTLWTCPRCKRPCFCTIPESGLAPTKDREVCPACGWPGEAGFTHSHPVRVTAEWER